MEYYLAEKCVDDSSIVEKRSIVCVDESVISVPKGSTQDIFGLDVDEKVFCLNDDKYSISRLSCTRLNKLVDNPSLRWGNLNKGNHLMSYRK